MATEKQKQAARRNLEKARAAQSSSSSSHSSGSSSSASEAKGRQGAQGGHGLSTAEKNDLPDNQFAFPKERKEPLTDARHVRNAVARFNQVEGVSDAERDQAWQRVQTAARKYDVELSEGSWRELAHGGKDR